MTETATPEAPPAQLRVAHDIAVQLHHMGNEPPAELRPASAPSFSRDQRRHADRTSIALERVRFGFVADVEPLHLTPVLRRRTLMRAMVCDDGTTTAGIYAVRARPGSTTARWLLTATGRTPRRRMLDLITTFDDGQVVMTNNGLGAVPTRSWPASIHTSVLAGSTAPAALVAHHRARLVEHRAAFPHSTAVPATDVPTITRLWAARSVVMNAHRRALGYVTDAELRDLLGKHHDTLARLVHHELDLLIAADTP